MKKQVENKQVNNKDLLDELYDIDNLKNDLDEVLNLEGITVSESLIQATLQKANKANEDNIIPYGEKVTGKKRGIPFRYGMIAACACILLVAGFNLVTNSPLEMGSKKENKNYQESTADSSTESAGMEYNGKTETTEDSVSENSSNDTAIMVPSIFHITKEDGDYYQVEIGEIEKIVIYDETGTVTHKETDLSYIESIYDALADIDSEDYEEVQNEEHEGQYVRKYDIIADEGLAWSELHLWISSTDQETYVVTTELKTSDGETITHQINDVSSDIIMNVINTEP